MIGRQWMLDALCAQTGGDWYADNTEANRDIIRDAKRVCRMCCVKDVCLEYALETDEKYGIWGGIGPRTRARIRQKRAQQPPPPFTAPHGTEAGYVTHRRRGENACPDCAAASREAARRRRKDRKHA